MPTKLTTEILTAAVLGFEEQKRHIDTKIAELRAMLDGGNKPTAATPEPTKRKRRRMSAAGRANIVAALKKRWAAKRAAAEKAHPSAANKAKPKKTARRVAAVKAPPAKAASKSALVQKAAVKKSTPKKMAPAPAQGITEAGVQ